MRQFLKITSIFTLALVFTAGMAFGQSNEAVIEQIDNNNVGTIDQVGQQNAAEVNQGEDVESSALLNTIANNVLGYPLTTPDFGAGTANNNEATVDQEGFQNIAVISQGYEGFYDGLREGEAVGNTGSIEQVGDRNAALPGQGLRGGEAVNNDFSIYQDGTKNVALTSQGSNTGYAEANEGNIEQFGNGNDAKIFQATPQPPGGIGTIPKNYVSTNSLGEVFQDGTGNEATITQRNGN